MSVDFRNTNTVWSSILTETLKRLGLTTAVICPGSRSAPLAVAFAQQQDVEAIPVLDERSAAFFALGIAKKSKLPVALICTSGTAGANFYSAVIEARESRIPLLVFTADRPPEMRECHSGQTIDQVKLFGNYPNWQAELAVPSLDMGMLKYLRQTVIHAWERSLFPVPGSVHLNIPFRDPLAPVPDGSTYFLKQDFPQEEFFAGVNNQLPTFPTQFFSQSLIEEWRKCERGIIIAGTAEPQYPQEYCEAIANLSRSLGWAVLAEGLSPLRNYSQLNPYLISTYDLIIRNQRLAKDLTPEIVIQIGELPTSKELRNWISLIEPKKWIVDPSHHNFDPLHGKTTYLRISIEQLASQIPNLSSIKSEYLHLWCTTEAKVRAALDQTMSNIQDLFEGKAAWLLSQVLPAKTPIFIANSMPVRDVEFFWKPNNLEIQPFFNRGANGIDGTLSTALGVAHHHQSSVMLTGDLTLLHDTNGFLLTNKIQGHLTIILINNNGGGIFEMLPIAKFEPPFEDFFATPQDINFARICATYDVEHELIISWYQLRKRLNPLPKTGIRILELRTNRREDAIWRQKNLGKLAD